ncbi:MAG TPA: NIPSNAP family protein [Rhizomicrobium sp.]|jgi:hypothetical protein|nr:NIPSNAP family protein [Rhizomicrobium sp.]
MSPIVELRQYTLKPGQRDVLIDLFEREFIESQEAAGMEIIATFRDAGNPDRFVWLRGFPDMESRAKALAAFYGGPVWKAHREAANATMLDSNNVLLLRPAWSGSGFESGIAQVPGGQAAIIVATIRYFDAPVSDAALNVFRKSLPLLPRGTRFVAAFVTDHSGNTFPALPVREGENAFVWFATIPDLDAAHPVQLPEQLEHHFARPPETLRLLPTRRSRLRGQ